MSQSIYTAVLEGLNPYLPSLALNTTFLLWSLKWFSGKDIGLWPLSEKLRWGHLEYKRCFISSWAAWSVTNPTCYLVSTITVGQCHCDIISLLFVIELMLLITQVDNSVTDRWLKTKTSSINYQDKTKAIWELSAKVFFLSFRLLVWCCQLCSKVSSKDSKQWPQARQRLSNRSHQSFKISTVSKNLLPCLPDRDASWQ